MGAGPSKEPTTARMRLLETTKTTRTIIDIILDYLLKEIKIRDFYLLSSPAECKKYVLFLANKISSEFIQFQIQPTVDKSGTIAFRSVKDLTEPPEPERKKRQFLCLELAYFYVRIFQIYGALALTLLDDASYTQQRGFIGYMKNERGSLQIPGTVPYRATGPVGRFAFTRKTTGGRVSNKSALGNFRFLDEILTDMGSRSRYRVQFDGKGTRNFFSLADTLGFETEQKGQFIVYLTQDKSFKINVTAKESRLSDEITLKFDTIVIGSDTYAINRLHDNSDNPILPKVHYYFESETKHAIRNGKNVETTYWKTTTDGVSVEDTMKTILDKLTDYVKIKVRISRDDGYAYETGRRENVAGIFEEHRDVDERLRIGKTVENLTRKRPIAHCVSRALQLLETAPLGVDTGTLESKICDTRFLESKATIPMGKPLSTSAGLTALANLYYDIIEQATPKLIQDDESAKEYLNFVRQMAHLFIGSEPGKSPDTVKSLADISSSPRDRFYCGSDNPSKTISLPMKYAREKVYPIVQALFNRQLQHAGNCAKILEQLFVIQKLRSGEFQVHVHPNIFKKGLGEINRIGRLTRNLLANYYTSCELDYINGLNAIAKFETEEKARLAPPAPRPVPTAPPATGTGTATVT